MTAPTPNAELAYKVLDYIDAHPEQWRQGIYIARADCGTVACFAGWACLLSGEQALFWGSDQAVVTDFLVADGDSVMVSERAEQLLRTSRYIDEGTEYEIDLFDGTNTRADLGRLVAEIFGPRPERES